MGLQPSNTLFHHRLSSQYTHLRGAWPLGESRKESYERRYHEGFGGTDCPWEELLMTSIVL